MQNNERKYLNEEKFQKNKKKLTKIGIIIMAVGVAIGLTIILVGVIKAANVEKAMTADLDARLAQEKIDNENRTQELTIENQELEAKKPILEDQMEELQTQREELRRQQSNEFRRAGFSDKYYELQDQMNAIDKEISNIKNEIFDIDSQIRSNESELWEIENGFNAINEDMERRQISSNKTQSRSSAFIAAPIIMLSLMIGGMLLFMANGRGIMAFQAQATMPIMKEGMQEMAPTMAGVMKDMAPAMGEVAGAMAKATMPVQKEIMREMMPMQKEIMREMGPSVGAYYGEVAKGMSQGFSSADTDNRKPCPYCGMKIDADSVFCEVCGKKL